MQYSYFIAEPGARGQSIRLDLGSNYVLPTAVRYSWG